MNGINISIKCAVLFVRILSIIINTFTLVFAFKAYRVARVNKKSMNSNVVKTVRKEIKSILDSAKLFKEK